MKLRKFCTILTVSIGAQLMLGQVYAQLPARHSDLPAEASPQWYAKAVDHIQEVEQAFYPQEDKSSFQVANPRQRLGFLIDPSGYKVSNILHSSTEESWQVQFRLTGIGRQSIQWKPGKKASVITDRDMLRYVDPAVEVQYVNNKEGLRQNFIIRQRPSGTAPLSIHIQLTTSLTAKLESQTQLAFENPAKPGQTTLLYEDLKVWDNQYRPVPAKMILRNDQLTIEVDDRNASYPLTIDPINRTAEWLTTTDGVLAGLGLTSPEVLASLYGFSVAGVGDVNGDSYDDVAIGAPGLIKLFSSSTLAGVGAVFVYYGSDTGLSTIPAKRLQPNTAIAGALFGISIDGGDVTGDGINDIIVGAPLDGITATIGDGIAGTTTASVKAGKVYVFPGGNLTAPNPTNFLEVRLDGPSFFNNGLLGLLFNNITVNALYGFSVAVTDDLNDDGKRDIIVGAPGYVSIGLGSVRSGAAFVMLSDENTDAFPTIQQLGAPSLNLLGILTIPLLNIEGALFGFSVDGAGDYNGDGKADVVAGAPAGVNLSSLNALLSGQILGGSAYVYFGRNDDAGVNTTPGARLQAGSNILLGNALNLFGMKVKGVKDVDGNRNGNIVVGAPLGGLLANTLSLTIKTGVVHVFKQKTPTTNFTQPITSDQQLESPRPANILQGLLSTLQLSVLFGTAIDNAYDVNGDGYPDLIVGEPLSSGINLGGLQLNPVGGAAYVFYGDGNGGYDPTPPFHAAATYGNDFLSVNTTALFGYSVAGTRNTRGPGTPARIIIGSPVGALDFNNSLLDLGSTLGTVLNFAAGANGLGKAYSFDALLTPLPVTLVDFTGKEQNKGAALAWNVREELDLHSYEVYHSTDGVHFNKAAIVFPWENQHVENKYEFLHDKTRDGLNYYRLKMVDRDGAYKLSNIVAVRIGQVAASQLTVAPNPVAADRIRVILSGLNKGAYRMELRNTAGQLQQVRRFTVTQRDQIEYMERNGSALPGIYWLTVYDQHNQKIGTSRVIVQ
ncbi:MAG: integrin alpha [Candidatus Pseudobacter hemicellulosilyticus]|uniref:Integrin alpha n=1 Tax=Candidatus Pseudobacter hemicellulosilyticus TaxID=3121375 RepID=A0AAJ5WTQ8_9BACT|nr:MAG: integrin alpha [Pseudobacter sp.]